MWVRPLGWEDPPEEGMATTTPVSLPGGSYGQRSLVGYSPWGGKESDFQSSQSCGCGRQTVCTIFMST